MRSLFNEYNNQYGISREEVLNDKGNSEFLKCCEYVSEERKQGDPQYVANFLSYLDKYQIIFLTQNVEQITYQIDFNGRFEGIHSFFIQRIYFMINKIV